MPQGLGFRGEGLGSCRLHVLQRDAANDCNGNAEDDTSDGSAWSCQ